LQAYIYQIIHISAEALTILQMIPWGTSIPTVVSTRIRLNKTIYCLNKRQADIH